MFYVHLKYVSKTYFKWFFFLTLQDSSLRKNIIVSNKYELHVQIGTYVYYKTLCGYLHYIFKKFENCWTDLNDFWVYLCRSDPKPKWYQNIGKKIIIQYLRTKFVLLYFVWNDISGDTSIKYLSTEVRQVLHLNHEFDKVPTYFIW